MLVRTICLHSYHLMFVGFIPSLVMNRQITFRLSIQASIYFSIFRQRQHVY
ncbi:hypothetical protein BHE74_00052407 [Ensete ventricosum]|nr:hypothetical protein BHE74_00052407 [Ensete ventricosum]